MITSKQIINISEDYFDTKNINGKPLFIFINPTLKEVIESSAFSKKMLGYSQLPPTLFGGLKESQVDPAQ